MFLRTEHLFQSAKFRFNHSNNSWDLRECVNTIIELYNLIERTEFRSELLKELERHVNSLQRLGKTPTINHQALDKVLRELETSSEILRSYSAKQGLFPKDNDLLNSIRQRLMIPGGTCSFDLPDFHYWLHLPHQDHHAFLTNWIEVLAPLEEALRLILELIRQSSLPIGETAMAGTFQKTLNAHTSCQLIRIQLETRLNVYPEISASKHRVNVRFLNAHFDQGKPTLTSQNIPFELTCCAI